MNLPEIFDKVTTIKPAPGSSRLFRTDKGSPIQGATEQFWGKNEFDQDVLLNEVPYNRERFDGTRQLIGPEFDNDQGKWMMIDPNDPFRKKLLKENSDIINAFVVEARLINDMPDHPDFNKRITKIDIFDRKDPFFMHKDVRLNLEGGEAQLRSSTKDALNVLILLAVLARPIFALGGTTRKFAVGSKVKFIVVDNKIDKRIKKQERLNEDKSRGYYASLDKDQKLELAIALNTGVKPGMDPDIIDDIIYGFATDNITKYSGNTMLTKMEAFVDMIERGKDYIKASYAIHLGMKYGIVRQQNKQFTAFSRRLGASTNEAIKLLLAPDNTLLSEILDACEEFMRSKVFSNTPSSQQHDSFTKSSGDEDVSDLLAAAKMTDNTPKQEQKSKEVKSSNDTPTPEVKVRVDNNISDNSEPKV